MVYNNLEVSIVLSDKTGINNTCAGNIRLSSRSVYPYARELLCARIFGNYLSSLFYGSDFWYLEYKTQVDTHYSSRLHFHDHLPDKKVRFDEMYIVAHLIGLPNMKRLVVFAKTCGLTVNINRFYNAINSLSEYSIQGETL